MSVLLGLILSVIPLGTYIYDFYKKPISKEFRMNVKHTIHSFAPSDSSMLPLPTLKANNKDYKATKSAIKARQTNLKEQFLKANKEQQTLIIKEAGEYITQQLVNGLFPHWYGTTWSFDGYTAVPNKGEVGCSYFVSTTLLHAGFNLNRYTLAQQGPVSEATSLALGNQFIQIDVGLDFNAFIPTIQRECTEGIYFIGLGHSHVGYIYYREQEVYFIQSSYGKSMSVVIDYAEESDILTGFGSFTLVPITTNYNLIEHWITGKEITITKGKE